MCSVEEIETVVNLSFLSPSVPPLLESGERGRDESRCKWGSSGGEGDVLAFLTM